MKDIPTNFGTSPDQEPHKYFRNLCQEFRKLLVSSKDSDQLQFEMTKLINASRDLSWKHKCTQTYKKDVGEKACQKVWHEFSRFMKGFESNPNNLQDLLDAIMELERLLKDYEVK